MGAAWSSAHEIGSVEIITCIQKRDTCQDLNGFSAPVHWTQSFPKNKKLKKKKKENEIEEWVEEWGTNRV